MKIGSRYRVRPSPFFQGPHFAGFFFGRSEHGEVDPETESQTSARAAKGDRAQEGQKGEVMATPSKKQRKQHPASDFGDPADMKYPLWGGRAANAKARAVQEYQKGKLSKAKEEQVIRRANRKLKSK